MSDFKKLTAEQLLSADPMSLTPEQIAMRRELVKLRKEEIECEKVAHENQQYLDQKIARESKAKAGKEAEQAMREKIEAEQSTCVHNTGGEGRMGFFQGDGNIYGSSTSVQELPTGEAYALCFRCQREWRHPKWPTLWPDGVKRTGMRAVMDGLMTLDEYRTREKEYLEIMRKPRKSFAALNGEYCAASKFYIPQLEDTMRRDASEFETYCKGRRKAAV